MQNGNGKQVFLGVAIGHALLKCEVIWARHLRSVLLGLDSPQINNMAIFSALSPF